MNRTYISLTLVSMLVTSWHCSTVQKVDSEKAATLPAKSQPLNYKSDFSFTLPEQALKKPKIVINTVQPAANDYVKEYKDSFSILAYLKPESNNIRPEHFAQLISFLNKDLNKDYKIRFLKQSFALQRPLSQKNLEKKILTTIQLQRPRLLFALSSSSQPGGNELTIDLEIVDPVYLAVLAKKRLSYTISENDALREGLVAFSRAGKKLDAIAIDEARNLVPAEYDLKAEIKTALSGTFSIYAFAPDIRLTLEGEDKKTTFSSLPLLNKQARGGTYKLIAERNGFEKIESEFFLRAGKSIEIHLKYPDDPRQNPVGLYSVPEGLLIYENGDRFSGFTPKIWDKKLKTSKSLRLIQRKVEEEKTEFYEVNTISFDGQADTLLVWQQHEMPGAEVLADGGFFQFAGNLQAFNKPVQLEEKTINQLVFQNAGSFTAASPRVSNKAFGFALDFSQLQGQSMVGLTDGQTFVFIEGKDRFFRAMAGGKMQGSWVTPKDEKKTEIGARYSAEEKKVFLNINGKSFYEHGVTPGSNWRIFIMLKQQEKQETKIQAMKWYQ